MTRSNFTRDFEPPLYAMPNDDEDAGLNPLLGFANRQKWLISGLTVVCAGLTLLLVNVAPAKYIGEAVVEPGTNTTNIGPNDASTNPQPISPELVRSEIDVVQSHAVVDRVINSLNLLKDPELNTRSILSRLFSPPRLADKSRELQGIVEDNVLSKLKVDNDGRSFGLHITFASKSPDKAAAIANAFAQQYVQQQIALRTSSAQNTVQWLDSRMDYLRGNMNKSEAAVADFKIAHRLFDVQQSGPNASAAGGGTSQTVSGQQLSELNNQLAVAKANAAIAETKLKAAIQNGNGVASTSVLSSPIIQALVTQEAQVQQKIADLQSHVGPKYPALIAAQSQLVQIQDKIKLETGNVVAGLSADAAAAKTTESLINDRLTSVESESATELTQRVRLEELQHQADSDRQIFQDFLSKQAVTAEQAVSRVPGATILAPATSPLFPAFPKKKLLFLIGSVFSFLFAVAVGYLVDGRNRRPRRVSPPLDQAPAQTAA